MPASETYISNSDSMALFTALQESGYKNAAYYDDMNLLYNCLDKFNIR